MASLEVAPVGALVRPIIDGADAVRCDYPVQCCTTRPSWAVTRELFDGQDDPIWYACINHLSYAANETVEYEDDEDDDE